MYIFIRHRNFEILWQIKYIIKTNVTSSSKLFLLCLLKNLELCMWPIFICIYSTAVGCFYFSDKIQIPNFAHCTCKIILRKKRPSMASWHCDQCLSNMWPQTKVTGPLQTTVEENKCWKSEVLSLGQSSMERQHLRVTGGLGPTCLFNQSWKAFIACLTKTWWKWLH